MESPNTGNTQNNSMNSPEWELHQDVDSWTVHTTGRVGPSERLDEPNGTPQDHQPDDASPASPRPTTSTPEQLQGQEDLYRHLGKPTGWLTRE